MSDLGRIIAGFVGGASGTALDIMKEGREDQREMRKAKLLAQLRLQTDKEIADYTNKLDLSKLDKDLTTTENGKVIMRDKAGNVTLTRDMTADEREAQAFSKEDRSLSLDAKRADIASARADIGLKGAQAQYYRNGGSGGGGSNSIDPASIDWSSELLFRAKDSVEEARRAGIDDADIQSMADRIVQREKAAGKSLQSAERQLKVALKLYKAGMKPGLTQNEKPTLDRAAFNTARDTFRKARGLDSR